MTGKKIGRRELFKLLPGGVLAALAGLSAAIAAGDEVETIQVELGIDSAQLPEVLWYTPPLTGGIDTDTTDYSSLPWIYGGGKIADNCEGSLVIE